MFSRIANYQSLTFITIFTAAQIKTVDHSINSSNTLTSKLFFKFLKFSSLVLIFFFAAFISETVFCSHTMSFLKLQTLVDQVIFYTNCKLFNNPYQFHVITTTNTTTTTVIIIINNKTTRFYRLERKEMLSTLDTLLTSKGQACNNYLYIHSPGGTSSVISFHFISNSCNCLHYFRLPKK